jgi:hypothetical protein
VPVLVLEAEAALTICASAFHPPTLGCKRGTASPDKHAPGSGAAGSTAIAPQA